VTTVVGMSMREKQMFRTDSFTLIGAALVGSATVVFASLSEAPFFPSSLQTTLGECPEHQWIPAHRRPVLVPGEDYWFAHQLLALHEAPLAWEGAEQRPQLRFTLFADGWAMSVRVRETDRGRLLLTAKSLSPCSDGRGCFVEKVLSPTEQARLETAVEPLLGIPPYGCDSGVDGSNFVLEASDAGGYRIWHQWSPRSGELRAAGEVFLDLAGWPPDYGPNAPTPKL